MVPLFVPQVKSGPTDDEIHQAHLDSIKVIHVEPPSSSLPQEPASGYLSGGLGLTLGLGVSGLTALSFPLLEASGSALQGLSQRDALSLLSLQPFQTSFLLQPDGSAAAASATSSGVKPGEMGRAASMELADIQQILKVATTAPNQMGLPPLAKAPGFNGSQGGCWCEPNSFYLRPLKVTQNCSVTVASSCRSCSGSEGDASAETQTSHQSSLQPHNDNSSTTTELPAGLTGLHQSQPSASHALPLQNALLVLFLSWERRADGRRVHQRHACAPV